jgi:hypothetical protein
LGRDMTNRIPPYTVPWQLKLARRPWETGYRDALGEVALSQFSPVYLWKARKRVFLRWSWRSGDL